MKYFLTVKSDPTGESWLTLRALLGSMAISSEWIEMEFEYFGQDTNMMPFASVQGNLTPGTEATLHHHWAQCCDPFPCIPNEQKDVIHLHGLKGRWWWLWFQFFKTWYSCVSLAVPKLPCKPGWPRTHRPAGHMFSFSCVSRMHPGHFLFLQKAVKEGCNAAKVGWGEPLVPLRCAGLLDRGEMKEQNPRKDWSSPHFILPSRASDCACVRFH